MDKDETSQNVRYHFFDMSFCAMLHTHSLILVTGEGVSTYRYNSASFLLNVLVRGRSADFIRGCLWMDVGEGWQEGDGVEEIRLDNKKNHSLPTPSTVFC